MPHQKSGRVASTTLTLLLRTLLEKAQLGKHFKTLIFFDEFDYCSYDYEWGRHPLTGPPRNTTPLLSSHWANIKSILRQYLGTSGVLAEFQAQDTQSETAEIVAKKWLRNMSGAKPNFRYLSSIFLLLTPNIERLVIMDYGNAETFIWPVLFTASKIQVETISLTGGPYSYTKLKELILKTTGLLSICKVVSLLQMTSLRKLTCIRVGTSSITDRIFSAPSQICHLTLLLCDLPLLELFSILPNCKQLKRLKISYCVDEENPPSSMPHLVSSLGHLQNKLEVLNFLKFEFRELPRKEPFPSLAVFQNLRTLSLNGDAFFLPNASTNRPFEFSDLPPNLEQLAIRDPPRARIVPLLSRNIQLLPLVPKLSGIHIEFHVGHSEGGESIHIPLGGYWPGDGQKDKDCETLSDEYELRGVRMSFEFKLGYPEEDTQEKRQVYVYENESEQGGKLWKRVLMKGNITKVTQFAVTKLKTQSLELSGERPSRMFHEEDCTEVYYTE